ncbi:MAG: hypothetical protein A3E87_10395 [Gammaproteobacteria bacterium RIFCSPHIGHO2_12_FULL_35_23]|nr:MAG: hypothetical protein A3E87_10395 [Gammaproteobacteria bacterium RIFCSPHIGHO2_12_FULL_35_23]
MTTRSLVIVLLLLFGILQYKLWASSTGIAETINLNKAITTQLQANDKLENRNQILHSQVAELQQGQATIEDLARNEIGMIKPGETYYQYIQ